MIVHKGCYKFLTVKIPVSGYREHNIKILHQRVYNDLMTFIEKRMQTKLPHIQVYQNRKNGSPSFSYTMTVHVVGNISKQAFCFFCKYKQKPSFSQVASLLILHGSSLGFGEICLGLIWNLILNGTMVIVNFSEKVQWKIFGILNSVFYNLCIKRYV